MLTGIENAQAPPHVNVEGVQCIFELAAQLTLLIVHGASLVLHANLVLAMLLCKWCSHMKALSPAMG